MTDLTADRWMHITGRGAIAILTPPSDCNLHPGMTLTIDHQLYRLRGMERFTYPEGGAHPAYGLLVSPIEEPSGDPAASTPGTEPDSDVTVLSFLTRFHLPCTRERGSAAQPSRSEIRRWCEQQAVLLNGQRVHWSTAVSFPVWQLIFFPNSRDQRVTFVDRPSTDPLPVSTTPRSPSW